MSWCFPRAESCSTDCPARSQRRTSRASQRARRPGSPDMSADDRVGSQSRAELAADLAVRGGRLALEHFYQARASVTDAQMVIRSALGREIARCFPMDGLLGGQPPRQAPLSDARYEWILDAIDETHNFVRGLPGFCVSVGILREGDVFASAV